MAVQMGRHLLLLVSLLDRGGHRHRTPAVQGLAAVQHSSVSGARKDMLHLTAAGRTRGHTSSICSRCLCQHAGADATAFQYPPTALCGASSAGKWRWSWNTGTMMDTRHATADVACKSTPLVPANFVKGRVRTDAAAHCLILLVSEAAEWVPPRTYRAATHAVLRDSCIAPVRRYAGPRPHIARTLFGGAGVCVAVGTSTLRCTCWCYMK